MLLAELTLQDQLSLFLDSEIELPVPPPLVIVTLIPPEVTSIVPMLKSVAPIAADVVGAAPLTAK